MLLRTLHKDFDAKECEWSWRRRRAETETISRRAIELDCSRRRWDGETPEQTATVKGHFGRTRTDCDT